VLPDTLAAAISDRYHLERELGQGGMATVYLAQDLKHDREVAVKVLRPELAAMIGAERFLSEIRTTARLQHPHILPLHDSGSAGPWLFYVMPFIQGETLRDRLTREKQLPIGDTVRIVAAVASALDYAHRHGVIHRDIKPENILLHDGQALVADFGIALAASKSGASRMTETGMSLGTPHYMSPEQAMGEREITARSDVYAVGCVAYEMLTGEPPFTGSSAQAIVARVLTEEPRRIIPQRKSVPPTMEAAVLTALEKLPADRFPTAIAFAEAFAGGRGTGPGETWVTPSGIAATGAVRAAPGAAAARPAADARWRLGAIAAGGVALAALGLAGWALSRPAAAAAPASRNYVILGDSTAPSTAAPSLALSPDGSTLVFRDANPTGGLWLKRRDALQPVALAGTERASNPAFSPDGQWIVFVADGRLKKVGAAGGLVSIVADSAAASGFGGAAWLDDGTIIFIPPQIDELRRVSASGGAVTRAFRDSALATVGLGMPVALPGSRGVLFQGCASGCVTMGIRVLDLRTGRQKMILPDAAQAVYLGNGRILYVRRDGTALVAGFDLETLEVKGQGTPVFDGVQIGLGFAHLVASPTGTVVYIRGSGNIGQNIAVRVAADGSFAPIDPDWFGAINSFDLSPDGRRMAVGTGTTNGDLNVWIKQLDQGPTTRLSFGGRDRRPSWSPDGRTVAFLRDTGTTTIVMARAADGSSAERVLARIPYQPQEIEWSSDGKWLILRTDSGNPGAGDLLGVQLDEGTGNEKVPVPLVTSPFLDLSPSMSPDGKWLAYASSESGALEVYVRPFPATQSARTQISVNGGSEPRWSRDGRILYFLDAIKHMNAAHVTTAGGLAVTRIDHLFDATGFRPDGFHQSYETTADGHFIFLAARRAPGQSAESRVVWIDNLPGR
jgi:serine/threonine-protein kinase